jgi:hypothetical protein
MLDSATLRRPRLRYAIARFADREFPVNVTVERV